MTDDDAFLRAMLAAPADELPRLVYADWLDDRGDPRGAYLRREHAAHLANAKAWRADPEDGLDPVWVGLAGAAAGLDPVWVARVSRPPAGVFCELLIRSDIGRPVTPDHIDRCTNELGVPLPIQLRALLLNCNPHNLKAGWFELDRREMPLVKLFHFAACADPCTTNFDGDLFDQVEELQGVCGLRDDLLFLCSSGGGATFMASGGKSDAGVVYFMANLGAGINRFADSIGEFLYWLNPIFRQPPSEPPEDRP